MTRRFCGSIAALAFLASPAIAALGNPPAPIVSQNQRIGLGDDLSITLPQTGVTDATHTIDKLILFLNDRKLSSLHPIGNNPVTRTVTFRVVRSQADAPIWNTLLGSPHGYTAHWTAAVGYDDLGAISTNVPLDFIVLHKNTWLIFMAGLAAIVLSGIWAALYTGILRDQDGYYSLGRTQMLFWFFLIVGSFGYIWLITADLDILIPNTVLGLLGISATTALAAGFIDDDNRKKNTPALVPPAPVLAAAAGAGGAAAAAAPALIPAIPAPPMAASPVTFVEHVKKFAFDILCSGNTVDLHRFQILVWTLVLGAVFIESVYVDLAMPDFNTSLLTLMGISSGTYIGFKFREQP